MELQDFIKQYRKEHSLTMQDLADRCGLSKGYISMLESGKHPQNKRAIVPSIETYGKLAVGMNMQLDELLRAIDGSSSVTVGNVGIQPMPSTYKVPRLGRIACGDPILAEENIEDYDDVPSYIKCDFTLVCRGDSMINARIFDGDIVCIKADAEVNSGDIAAVLVDDDTATLKRVRLFDDHIILEPENPTYKPKVFWNEDMNRVRIIGKATHFISVVK